MSDITLIYPGGAGGNWLSNLVYCLEYNLDPADVAVNYHNTPRSYSIRLTHNNAEPAKYYSERPCYLNGQALFNIYLNVTQKLWLHEFQINTLPMEQMCETLTSESSSKLSFLDMPTDLDWNAIILSPDRFIEQLFSVLDANRIHHTKNVGICKTAIARYRDTCADPEGIYNNWDNILWLFWCNGISKRLNNDYITARSIEELRDFLYPRREFFRDYTAEYTIYWIRG